MEFLATVAFSLGVIAYSVASTLFFVLLLRPTGSASAKWAFLVLAGGAAAHAAHIVAASLFARACPIDSIHFALSAAALVVVALFLVLGRRQRLDALGIFVGPLALTFLVAAQFVGEEQAHPALSRVLLGLHVMSNLLGLGFVLLSGGVAAFYVFEERRLKQKRISPMRGRLPSLDVLDLLGHRLLLIGFPLLTVGVVTGGFFFTQLGASSGISFVRAILGYATWALVLAVLLLRALGGWRGRRSAYGTLAGVVGVSLVLLVYLLRPFWGLGA